MLNVVRFGRPGKGNDKGKVEGLVGYVRRSFMTPLPVADSFDALNARFLSTRLVHFHATIWRISSPPLTLWLYLAQFC